MERNRMARSTWLTLAAFVCTAGFLPDSATAQVPGWLTDLDEAQRQSAQSGKPIFVVFRCER